MKSKPVVSQNTCVLSPRDQEKICDWVMSVFKKKKEIKGEMSTYFSEFSVIIIHMKVSCLSNM